MYVSRSLTWVVLKWVLLILTIQTLWLTESEGATYNFYINNTENGTGTPTVTVSDPEKSDPAPILPALPLTSATASQLNPAPFPPVPELLTTTYGNGFHRWRFGVQVVSVNLLSLSQRDTHYFQDTYSSTYEERSRYEPSITQTSALFSASYLVNPYIGITGLVGAVNGVEAELNLFPSHSFLQLAFMLGYGKPKISDGARSSALIGLQTALDFADAFGLQLSWRRFSGKWERHPLTTFGAGAYLKF